MMQKDRQKAVFLFILKSAFLLMPRG